MLRRLAGSSFAALLLTLMVTKHVALGFCLCQQHIIVGHDPGCCAESPTAPPCCCDDDGTPDDPPCRDCIVDLKLDVGDFLWSTDQPFPADCIATPLPLSSSTPALLPVARHSEPCPHPVRGSPPGQRLPLYLRTAALRL